MALRKRHSVSEDIREWLIDRIVLALKGYEGKVNSWEKSNRIN